MTVVTDGAAEAASGRTRVPNGPFGTWARPVGGPVAASHAPNATLGALDAPNATFAALDAPNATLGRSSAAFRTGPGAGFLPPRCFRRSPSLRCRVGVLRLS
ncbi:hypothetical protein GCM10023192_18600 [Amycolatopsis samaneae]